ncbi:MAG: hypothetical protein IKO28_06240 [Prevotella sp.]|nr:hypothetical protein [Prevotella sp.]
MKNLKLLLGLTLGLLTACTGKKTAEDTTGVDSLSGEVAVVDSALYGTVGKGTTMHTLELVDENGKQQTYQYNVDVEANVQGGLFSGDRITAVLTSNGKGEQEVQKVVNITSLCGKWTALDRNFEIIEDGTVISTKNMESNPYTQWSMVNCNLVLNRDTFDVLYVGPDSLTIESQKGIFVYKRQK